MNALGSRFQAVRGAILAATAPNETERIAGAWRIASQDIASDIITVRGFLRVIAEQDEMLTATVRVHRPEYVDYCVKALPWALSEYLRNVKTISETEAAMEARCIPFARSSDAWEN